MNKTIYHTTSEAWILQRIPRTYSIKVSWMKASMAAWPPMLSVVLLIPGFETTIRNAFSSVLLYKDIHSQRLLLTSIWANELGYALNIWRHGFTVSAWLAAPMALDIYKAVNHTRLNRAFMFYVGWVGRKKQNIGSWSRQHMPKSEIPDGPAGCKGAPLLQWAQQRLYRYIDAPSEKEIYSKSQFNDQAVSGTDPKEGC